jgi:hypothetical protein
MDSTKSPHVEVNSSNRAKTATKAGLLSPFIFAIYPVFALYAANLHEVYRDQTYRPLIASLVLSGVIYLLFFLMLRNWEKAAVISSLAILLFFTYGHIYDTIRNAAIHDFIIGRHRYLLLVFLVVFAVITWIMLKAVRDWKRFAGFLAVSGLILLLLPAVSITVNTLRSQSDWDSAQVAPDSISSLTRPPGSTQLPDIYYLIFDGYARGDVMQETIHYDNSEFLALLEEQGFYVAGKSNANHTWTALSLASSLNMVFAQDLGLNLRPGTYPAIFADPIRHSRVRALLEDMGYSTVATRTGYIPTEIADADVFLQPDAEELEGLRRPLSLNAFEGMLLQSTAMRVLNDFERSLELHLVDISGQAEYEDVEVRTQTYSHEILRQIILAQFEQIASIPSLPEPTFAFVHIISPHSPFLFGPHGERVEQFDPFTLAATDGDSNERQLYYKGQAIYITSMIEDLVSEILANSPRPPIIIIQSDHGPSVVSSVNSDRLSQRTAILNAYFLPDECERHLYDSITPVNSFRVVFNCVFGADLPLLEDTVFFRSWPRVTDYEFIPVNDRID